MIHEGITTKRDLQVQRITALYIKCQSSHDYLVIVDLTITGLHEDFAELTAQCTVS